MKITRISVINDERGLILGKQIGNLLEPGIVYELSEMMGEIIIHKLGPYSLPKNTKDDLFDGGVTSGSDVNTMVCNNRHNVTVDEYINMKQKRLNEDNKQ